MGSMSGAVQSHLIAALNSMNLVSSTGQPTPLLDELVHADGKEREKLLRDLLRRSFPFLFEDGFKLETDTAKHFDEQFNKANLSFETARKCKAFFLAAAKDAGIDLSSYILKGARGQKSAQRKPRVTKNGVSGNAIVREEKDSEQTDVQQSSLTEKLLEKFPALDPAWPDDVKAKWFDAFQQLMNSAQGIKK